MQERKTVKQEMKKKLTMGEKADRIIHSENVIENSTGEKSKK